MLKKLPTLSIWCLFLLQGCGPHNLNTYEVINPANVAGLSLVAEIYVGLIPYYHAWVSDDQLAISGSEFGFYDVVSPETPIRTMPWDGQTRFAFMPSQNVFVTTNDDSEIGIWRLDNLTQIGELVGHISSINHLEFLDEHRLVSASLDGTVRIWDLDTQTELFVFAEYEEVWFLTVAPGANLIAASGSTGTTTLWNPDTGEKLQETESAIWSFTPDGGSLISRDGLTGELALLSLDQVINDGPTNAVTILNSTSISNSALQFNRDGSLMFIGEYDGDIRIVDTDTWEVVSTLEAHHNAVAHLAVNPSGTLLASSAQFENVRIWGISPDS